MNEVYPVDAGYLFVMGFALALGWLGLYLLGWVAAWVWAWIDDNSIASHNPFAKTWMKLFGYQPNNGYCAYSHIRTKKVTDGWIQIAVFPGLFLILFPLLFVKAPAILIVFAVSVAMAFLARFARRTKKLFDAHVSDKNAHK